MHSALWNHVEHLGVVPEHGFGEQTLTHFPLLQASLPSQSLSDEHVIGLHLYPPLLTQLYPAPHESGFGVQRHSALWNHVEHEGVVPEHGFGEQAFTQE